jgi:hypothetical protein
MNKSARYWLTARFRQTEDHRELLAPGMAFDATAADDLQRAVRNLRRRWDRHFRDLADDLSDYFAKKAADRSDADLKRMLRRSGMSVEFKLTAPMREALGAIVNENVSLIRSIPEQYLGKIEGAVMRSVVSGRDLKQLTDDILATYGVTRRRAETIARDQNNKASGALQRVRYQELGIMKAVWMHSHAGRDPRRTHVANDGKEFDVAEGWLDPAVNKRIWPGQLINCFPGSTVVGTTSPIRRLWKTMFKGDIVNIVVGSDLIQATPNHPILTGRGWIAADAVEKNDDLVSVLPHNGVAVAHEEGKSKTTFDDLFKACRVLFGDVRARGVGFDFHGDAPNGEVHDVTIDHDLLLKLEIVVRQNFSKRYLAGTYGRVGRPGSRIADKVIDASLARISDVLSVLLGGAGSGHNAVGLGATAFLDAGSLEHAFDNHPGRVKLPSDGRSAVTQQVAPDDGVLSFLREYALYPSATVVGYAKSALSEFDADSIGIMSDGGRGLLQHSAVRHKLLRVTDKFLGDYSGHVFTMQTDLGYYTVGASNILAKNCRCFARPVLE